MSTRAIVCAFGLLLSLDACSSDGKNGASGPAGTTALTKLSPEPAGMNCPGGGTKVEVLSKRCLDEVIQHGVAELLPPGRVRRILRYLHVYLPCGR